METYQEFLDRINSFEKREFCCASQAFQANLSLAQKIKKDNTFRDFYGDTVVFALDAAVKEKLAEYAGLLYHAAPECFCEKLVSNTFHMTLHDLGNSPVLHDVAEELFENELKVIGIMGEVQKYRKTKIKMKSNYIFNMVNTSLVLGLYPADKEEYRKIMGLYSIFDGVKKLNYPFTPHITLAYYHVDGFGLQAAKKLECAINQLNCDKLCQEIEIELDVERLYYQKFRSMNDYINIFGFGP